MISHVISVWSSTWSMHDSHQISAWSTTWSVYDQLRDQCMISHVISAWSGMWSVGTLSQGSWPVNWQVASLRASHYYHLVGVHAHSGKETGQLACVGHGVKYLIPPFKKVVGGWSLKYFLRNLTIVLYCIPVVGSNLSYLHEIGSPKLRNIICSRPMLTPGN